MKTFLLAAVLIVSSCSIMSLEEKTMLVSIGMDKETVLSRMGRYPNDRQFKASDEAWHYCGFKAWSFRKNHFVILFSDDLVVGQETLADTGGVCSELGPLGPGDRPTPIIFDSTNGRTTR